MATPRSITFVANHGHVAGGELMLLRMATVAASVGVDAHVVGPLEPNELALACEHAGLAYVATRRGKRTARYADTRRTVAELGSELIWANGPFPGLVALGAKRPWVLHLHQRPSRLQRPVVDLLRRAASVTVVPSHSMAQALRGSEVLWNWTDDPVDVGRTDGLGERLDIGFSGRLSPIKGVDVLAGAIQILVNEGVRPVRCHLAGDSRFVPRRLKKRVDAAFRPVRDHCEFLGWVEPADFLRRVSVIVVPSVWPEPFGLVAAEAMAQGTPLVVTRAGALPEVVGSQHPWIAAAGDPADLARVLREMRQAPAAVEQSIRDARERWESCFSPGAGRSRYLELLERLPDL